MTSFFASIAEHRGSTSSFFLNSGIATVQNETSNPVPVLSEVPQGTVLGPLMFLLHINDITKDTNSPLCMFADDCLLYRMINSTEDTIRLHLNYLQRHSQDFLKAVSKTVLSYQSRGLAH